MIDEQVKTKMKGGDRKGHVQNEPKYDLHITKANVSRIVTEEET